MPGVMDQRLSTYCSLGGLGFILCTYMAPHKPSLSQVSGDIQCPLMTSTGTAHMYTGIYPNTHTHKIKVKSQNNKEFYK